jgi:hypothetical protein
LVGVGLEDAVVREVEKEEVGFDTTGSVRVPTLSSMSALLFRMTTISNNNSRIKAS